MIWTGIWLWLKSHWQWVLIPLGIFATVARFFIGRKGAIQVAAPELTAAAAVQRAANDRASQEVAAASAEREQRLSQIQQEHKDEVMALVKEQQDKQEALLMSPEELAEYMLSISKKQRG